MEKQRTIETAVYETVTEYHYSAEEVKKLIIADLKSKGYEPKEVKLLTTYRYVSDEWGMNKHIQSGFVEAVADITI